MGTIDDLRSAQADNQGEVSIGIELHIPVDFLKTINEWYRNKHNLSTEDFNLDVDYQHLPDYLPAGHESETHFYLRWAVDLDKAIPHEPASAVLKALSLNLKNSRHESMYCSTVNKVEHHSNKIVDNELIIDKMYFPNLFRYYPSMQEVIVDLSYQGSVNSVDPFDNFSICGMEIIGALPINYASEKEEDYLLACRLVDEFVQLLIMTEYDSNLNVRNELEFHINTLLEDRVVLRNYYTSKVPDLKKYIPKLLEIFSCSKLLSDPESYWLDKNMYEQEAIKIAKLFDIEGRVHLIWELDTLRESARYMSEFCDLEIKYLGPLRETLLSTTPTIQTTDIGPCGEFTSSVLQQLRSETVTVPMPARKQHWVPLMEAVEAWGAQLGLLEAIRVVQEPKLGSTIIVKTEGLDKEVPLDAVGVGVSQLLPVLVLCLLSEPGSVILLEQPELHLHPALQQRLADFLIAIARSGRQLIVETHSEYMVSRLRRRIAEDPDDELLSISKVIFAERDGQTGITTYRDVELSPYGDIDEWPKGFFDQAAAEEREIIRGGLKKRAEKDF